MTTSNPATTGPPPPMWDRPLFEFLCRSRQRLRWQMLLHDALRATFWTALVCASFMAFRLRLGLRADVLLATWLVVTGVTAAAMTVRRRVDLGLVVSQLDLSADDGDRVVSGAEFLTDSDPFKRLALRKGEQWLAEHEQEITCRWHWPREWKYLPIALMLLVLAWWFMPGLPPAAPKLIAKTDERNVPAPRTPAPTSNPTSRPDDASQSEANGAVGGGGGGTTGEGQQKGSANARGAGGSAIGNGNAGKGSGVGSRGGKSESKGGATVGQASGGSGAGSGTHASSSSGSGGGRQSSGSTANSESPNPTGAPDRAQAAARNAQGASNAKTPSHDNAAAALKAAPASVGGRALGGGGTPAAAGGTKTASNNSRPKQTSSPKPLGSLTDVNAKRPTGVPPKEREKIVDAPQDAPDAALKPLGTSSGPPDYLAADLDPAELELLPPRRRAALLRYFRSPTPPSTQPTR